MAFSKEFERELTSLFKQRTHWLRAELGDKAAGKPPKFGRKKVDDGIRRLQLIASAALANKLAKAEFEEHIASRKSHRIKGWGPTEKKARFESWFQAYFGHRKGVIYSFWDTHRCIYIGRTGPHGIRPSAHFKNIGSRRLRE